MLTIDGQYDIELEDGDILETAASPQAARFARLGRPVRGGDVVNQGDLSVIVRSVRVWSGWRSACFDFQEASNWADGLPS